jgi:hypothetical protein
MASPVVTVVEVEDREDEPPHVYGALVGALSRGNAHSVHALLLETGLTTKGIGIFGNTVDGYLDGAERRCSSLSVVSVESSVESLVFEAIKRVLEAL